MSRARSLLVAAAFRIALLLYGDWQDRNLDVPYTDIDYVVFTDAARFVARGESPFKRATYRYTPLLAYLLVGNVWLHPAWGKVIFSVADLCVGWVIHSLLKSFGLNSNVAQKFSLLWLWNPFTFTISTRGSSDVLIAFVLLATLLAIRNGYHGLAGALWGFSVHWRIFPIIYGPSVVLFLAQMHHAGRTHPNQNVVQRAAAFLRSVFSPFCLKFGLAALGVFFGLGAVCYHLHGDEFLNEAFLHHLGRRDPRHNFSVYFYLIYLRDFGEGGGGFFDVGAVAFFPQVMLLLLVSWKLKEDLPFCWLISTVSFVAFNKVCTAQYFVWYFCLLPVVLPNMDWPPPRRFVLAVAFWTLCQLNWLWWAYLLEFQGLSTFLAVWGSSCLFLLANSVLIFEMIRQFSSRRLSFLKICLKGQGQGGKPIKLRE
ncbi:hypothetical protein BSKO_11340 [Bryopsis sp. KO-2023]|nr:hypothetical protein BSKO_11340 [Bryopsis sp. KO-2023]